MFEIFFVLSLFIALVWVIVHAVLLLVRVDSPDDVRARRGDPIATYVEENYGSHFQHDPLSLSRRLRNL